MWSAVFIIRTICVCHSPWVLYSLIKCSLDNESHMSHVPSFPSSLESRGSGPIHPPGYCCAPPPAYLPSSLPSCPVLRLWTVVEAWLWMCCLPNALQQRVLCTPGAMTQHMLQPNWPSCFQMPCTSPVLRLFLEWPHSHILPCFGIFASCFYALPDANLFSFRIVSSSAFISTTQCQTEGLSCSRCLINVYWNWIKSIPAGTLWQIQLEEIIVLDMWPNYSKFSIVFLLISWCVLFFTVFIEIQTTACSYPDSISEK